MVRPADTGGSPHAVDDVNVVGVVGVEFFDVAELPGAEHFADGVVDALLVGKNGGGPGIPRGVVLFLFLLRGGRGSLREAAQQAKRGEKGAACCDADASRVLPELYARVAP